MTYCDMCGAEVVEKDSFCAECGAEIKDPIEQIERDVSNKDNSPSHCENCGSDVDVSDTFCSECGTKLERDDRQERSSESNKQRTVPATETSNEDESIIADLRPTSTSTALSGVIFGLIIGFLFAWGLTEAGGVGIGFFGGLIGGTLYVWTRPTAYHSVASGLYISGIVLVLVPIMFYLPVIAGADSETLEGVGETIGGVLGLFIWTVVFAIIAAVIGLIGRSVKKRAPAV